MTRNTYSLDLEFHSPYPLKKGVLPGHAIAQVMVKSFSRGEQNGPSVDYPTVG